MSMKPNYFKIGIFVIVAFALIFVAIIVFGSGLLTEEKIYFETYFDGSVSGLSIGAPVELRGVKLGQVEKINFARYEYEMKAGSQEYYTYGNYVVVIVSLNIKNFPSDLAYEKRMEDLMKFISLGLRVRLASNLLTGQAYLQGEYVDPNRYPVLEVPWKPKNLYVSSAPGEFTTMKDSVDRILTKLEQVDTEEIGKLVEQILLSFNRAIDDANIPETSSVIQRFFADADQAINDAHFAELSNTIETFVANANKTIGDANVPGVSNQMQNLFAEARHTNQNLQELLKRPEKTQTEMANIAVMISNLNRALTRIDKIIITQGPQIEQTLENLIEVSNNIKELTNELKQHPSQMIFSQPPAKSEISK